MDCDNSNNSNTIFPATDIREKMRQDPDLRERLNAMKANTMAKNDLRKKVNNNKAKVLVLRISACF